MINVKNDKTYLFQGTSPIVPDNTPDSEIQNGLSPELIETAFAGFNDIDRFTIPSLEKGNVIQVATVPEGDLPQGWKSVQLRVALNAVTCGTMAEGRGCLGCIMRACHVGLWRRESRFCGSCGAANKDAENEEIARQCPACGRLEFPRISPAVIIIVTNDKGEAVLAHNKKFASGVYSIIAGFSEPGESLEDTVAREIKEEINIDVTDIRYIRSQPWPLPNSLMLGFTARYCGGELRPDGVELEEAKWFSRDNLPNLPGSASISRYLINLWKDGKL